MVCKHCGTQNPDSSTFCQGCGAKLGGSGTAGSNGAGGNNSYGGNYAVSSAGSSGLEKVLSVHRPPGFSQYRTYYRFIHSGSSGNGGFQGGNYNQNSNFNRSQLPNTASIPEEYQPISMWGYFGYELLFSIPLVGFILLLVFSFGGTKNKNLKNFARSYFCFMIVIIVLSIIFLGSTIGAALSYM